MLLCQMEQLAAHQKPPEAIKVIYKQYQKLAPHALHTDASLLDFARGLNDEQQSKMQIVRSLPHDEVNAHCARFGKRAGRPSLDQDDDVPLYEHRDMPGKFAGYLRYASKALTIQDYSSYHPCFRRRRSKILYHVCCMTTLQIKDTRLMCICITIYHITL